MDKFSYKNISNACVKCGKCIQVCTIHDINRDEVTSPRGFLDLIGAYDRGELKLDKNSKNIFESCFLCTNCVDACPNNLRVDTAIEKVRVDIAQKRGMALYKRAIFWLLGHRKILDLAARMGYVFQSCGFKIKKDSELGDSMSARISIPMLKKERLLPTASKKSFLNSHPDFIDNGGKRSIGIFIGCMGNYAYTDIGEGLLKICKELKINVDMLKKQACCGAPAYFTGDRGATLRAAKFNTDYLLEKLEKLDAIIIPEATCSGMIKMDYEHVFDGMPQWQEKARRLSKKIFLATEYFYKFTNLNEILSKKAKNPHTITYHDPCHARKMQGVYREPRALLSNNFTIVEMSNPNKCCGFGGVTMQSGKYNLSRASGQQKAPMIMQTNAWVVAAECSACKMQLNNALNLKNSEIRCLNPIELIAKVL